MSATKLREPESGVQMQMSADASGTCFAGGGVGEACRGGGASVRIFPGSKKLELPFKASPPRNGSLSCIFSSDVLEPQLKPDTWEELLLPESRYARQGFGR